MAKLVGYPLLLIIAGIVLLVTLFHLVLSLPVWLVVGGIALALWYRGGSRRRRLGSGNIGGYLSRRARW
jgi:hypothetical protein